MVGILNDPLLMVTCTEAERATRPAATSNLHTLVGWVFSHRYAGPVDSRVGKRVRQASDL